MSAILDSARLGSPPWPTIDPFLFCVHHRDHYPQGNAQMGPRPELLEGRHIGMDFGNKDGWSMYHGDVVPGFPRHPHRGFETVTIARRGYIDHSDSLGATARFGHGDVQWMTAGRGIVHSEMFPLVRETEPNPTELFQIWLNLPRADKMVEPHFTMLWSEQIPIIESNGARLRVVAGSFAGQQAPAPPPKSWASREESDLAIWPIELAPNTSIELPPPGPETLRALYFFEGSDLTLNETKLDAGTIAVCKPDTLQLTNGNQPAELLVLQGKPIGEPVAHHGPFVMTTTAEIREAITDYQRTGYGTWPWPSDAPVHDRASDRFAIHADGRHEAP